MDVLSRRELSRLKRAAHERLLRWRGKLFVHFLHIGKTGGSALKAALHDHRVTRRHALFLHGHRFTLRDVPPGEKAFFVLRDPIARFVSGFYSRQRMGRPRYETPWKTGEAEAFAAFPSANDLARALDADDPALAAKAKDAMRSIGHLRHPFLHWFESEAYFLARREDILFVGFQESLSHDFEHLKRRLGLPADLALPGDPVTAHRNPDDIDKRLDDQAVRNLRAWYAADYSFYELCRREGPAINRG
jgi:hypothetical protein